MQRGVVAAVAFLLVAVIAAARVVAAVAEVVVVVAAAAAAAVGVFVVHVHVVRPVVIVASVLFPAVVAAQRLPLSLQ